MTTHHSQTHRPQRDRRLVGATLERCIYCQSTAITKKGQRRKKLETLQLWYYHACNCVFTPQRAKGKTYPLKVILEALMLYYRGETRQRMEEHIKERFGVRVPPRTLSAWLVEYRALTTYARLRELYRHQFTPHHLIRSTRLHHKQVYMFRSHRGKLAAILDHPEHERFYPLATYLTEMAESCPHDLFHDEHRASSTKGAFDLTSVAIIEKQNLAPRLAGLILQIPLDTDATLTGPIDVLQIRNRRVNILDYKPNAQLMVYALALSRRTGLKLFDFVCAWFDEHHYYQFYPLHVVHKRPSLTRASGYRPPESKET